MKISTLRENLIVRRRMATNDDALDEMPHTEYGDASLDLCIEKYPMPDAEKRDIIRAYETVGVFAYAKKYNKWLHITRKNISAKETPTPDSIILPEYWQSYAKWAIL